VTAVILLAGRYRLADRLGGGGMAVVWRAHDEVLDRSVAVKVLAPGQAAGIAARARVQSEARAAAVLSHPNVAAVYDYGEATGSDGELVPYVVMELVDGVSLTDVLADGPVAPADAIRICADVAAALAAAHAHGLVHRDIKPGNVIVSRRGAKLVDFGIPAAIGSPDEPDKDRVMLETPTYPAPERPADGVVVPDSNVYALGLLLYRMLAGTTPWSAYTTTGMLQAHAYLPPRPHSAGDVVPAEVADLCERCLAKDPAHRPSASEVAAVLTRAARTGSPSGPAAPDLPRPAATVNPGQRAGAGEHSGSAGSAGSGSRGDGSEVATSDHAGSAHRRRLAMLAALVVVLAAGVFLTLPRLTGSPSGPRGSAEPQPGVGGVAAPGVPSSTAPVDGSDAPASGPGDDPSAPGSDSVKVGGQDGSGGGVGVRPPGGSPVGTATGPARWGAAAHPAVGTTAPPSRTRRSVDSPAGSAVVECVGKIARLVSWIPADGYKTQAVQPGPNPSVHVKFRAGNNQGSIRAKCVSGVPDVMVR
jgi:serine/threonine-protein kinase